MSRTPVNNAMKHACKWESVTLSSSCEEICGTLCMSSLHNQIFVLNVTYNSNFLTFGHRSLNWPVHTYTNICVKVRWRADAGNVFQCPVHIPGSSTDVYIHIKSFFAKTAYFPSGLQLCKDLICNLLLQSS
jgi:hypothetical protein